MSEYLIEQRNTTNFRVHMNSYYSGPWIGLYTIIVVCEPMILCIVRDNSNFISLTVALRVVSTNMTPELLALFITNNSVGNMRQRLQCNHEYAMMSFPVDSNT